MDQVTTTLTPAENGGVKQSSPKDSYVLVGGPGAGKSTTVKRMLIDNLRPRENLPIFLRLRDYQGFEHFEAFIAHKFAAASLEEPERLLQALLRSGKCLCILDGLDEVRPQMRQKTITDINVFYHKYFAQKNRLIVTCRKEAYRTIPLDLPYIMEVRPLTDEQIHRFAEKWPLGYPAGKSASTFWRDLASTPRILELARSPLLLVGGLVQYTESNLGIPEERFEYLGRVARWLVSEWAMAQGHPPDPLRQVYDRLLARLAYFMHKEQQSDIQRKDAERLFEEWLPTFGKTGVSVKVVIESIATRTGILVSDDRNFIVFAQFGLQEYFASLEVVQNEGVENLADLEPPEWWREVILLAVAQRREPTPILSALFEKAPLMAAATVAECPTPSTFMQKRAIEACIKSIDKGEKAASSAVVPLLRKVQDEIEVSLCSALEERLTAGEPVASLVGVALATAGTPRATSTLAKYPEIWDRCLREAGYLSTNFENLLVGWIKEGTEFQSAKAAELIASRLSEDRLNELLDLLITLTRTRADTLARLIIDHCGLALSERNKFYHYREDDPLLIDVPITIASRCIPFIRDREGYLRERVEKVQKRLKDVHPRNARPFFSYHQDVFEATGLVATCLYLENKSGQRLGESEMNRALNHAVLWARRRAQFFLWAVSGLSLGAISLSTVWSITALFIVLLFATFLTKAFTTSVPWKRYIHFFRRFELQVTLCLLISSALIAFLLSAQHIHYLQTAFVNIIVAIFILIGLLSSSGIYPRFYVSQPFFGHRKFTRVSHSCFSPLYGSIFFGLLFAFTALIFIFHESASKYQYIVLGVGGVFSLWAIFCIVKLHINNNKVNSSARRAQKFIDSILEKES